MTATAQDVSPPPRTAIVYVTDAGFALPSAVSAIAVRGRASASLADLYLVTVGLPERTVATLSEILQPHGVSVLVLETRRHADFDQRRFKKTHISVAAMARFFVLETLPRPYRRILYLDGDVWPFGNLDPLLEIDLPPGTLAAAEDTSHFCWTDWGPHGRVTRKYFNAIGVTREGGYFNSGVLLADCETWHDISTEAFNFFILNAEICRYHDQSALNAVASARRVRLSPSWNFCHLYREWGVAPISDAKLMHFAGGFKPWTVASPFYPGLYDLYRRSFELFRATELDAAVLPPDEMRLFERRLVVNRLKINTVHLARRWRRRREYRYLQSVALPS